MTPAVSVALQTPTPGVGPAELETILPILIRIAWFLVGLVGTVLVGWTLVEPAVNRAVIRRNRGNRTLHEAITRYVRLIMIVIGALIGATLAGYGQLLADSALVVAAATLALGVAAQTIIGSLVSGIVLVLDPEFNVGDYIEWEDQKGVVQSITLRVTRVVTPGGELVTVPNTVLTEQAVTRPYGRSRYQSQTRIGVAYDADVERALRALEAAAGSVQGVLDDPPPRAYVEELGDDAIVLLVHYWVKNPREQDVLRVRSAFAREAMDRLESEAIEISPPSQQELLGHIAVDAGEKTPSTARPEDGT